MLGKYMPLATDLASRHGLTVPPDTIEMLAKTIMHSPFYGSKPKGEIETATVELKKGLRYIKKLQKFSRQPPTRSTSIPASINKLCAVLRTPRAALALVLHTPSFDPIQEADFLKAGMPAQLKLRNLEIVFEKVITRASSTKRGRPWSALTYIVTAACIAWRNAGRAPTFSYDSEVIKGPLPNFIEDLLACCGRGVRGGRDPANIASSPLAMRDAIVACKKSGLFLLTRK